MAGVAAGSEAEYFAKARTFDQDRAIAAERSSRLAWMITGGACVLTAVAGLAVAMLAPLKTVEPFVVRVDNASGVVDVVSPLRGTQTYDEAVIKYFAAIYVRSREGFVPGEAEAAFRTVSLMSGDGEQGRFAAHYSGRNPESPQVLFGNGGSAKITIKSMSMLGAKVASMRYSKRVVRNDEVKVTHWVATIVFDFVAMSAAESDRLINPLGFHVLEYRVDPEAP